MTDNTLTWQAAQRHEKLTGRGAEITCELQNLAGFVPDRPAGRSAAALHRHPDARGHGGSVQRPHAWRLGQPRPALERGGQPMARRAAGTPGLAMTMTGLSRTFGKHSVDGQAREPRIRRVLEAVAARYDLMNDLMSLGVHRLWKRSLVGLAAAASGQDIVDLPGGTGEHIPRPAASVDSVA